MQEFLCARDILAAPTPSILGTYEMGRGVERVSRTIFGYKLPPFFDEQRASFHLGRKLSGPSATKMSLNAAISGLYIRSDEAPLAVTVTAGGAFIGEKVEQFVRVERGGEMFYKVCLFKEPFTFPAHKCIFSELEFLVTGRDDRSRHLTPDDLWVDCERKAPNPNGPRTIL